MTSCFDFSIAYIYAVFAYMHFFSSESPCNTPVYLASFICRQVVYIIFFQNIVCEYFFYFKIKYFLNSVMNNITFFFVKKNIYECFF